MERISIGKDAPSQVFGRSAAAKGKRNRKEMFQLLEHETVPRRAMHRSEVHSVTYHKAANISISSSKLIDFMFARRLLMPVQCIVYVRRCT